MRDDLIAVTLRLCGVSRVAAQPRLPMSSEVGRVVLVDWLIARGITPPHGQALATRAPRLLPTAPQTYLAAPIFVDTTNTSIWPYNAIRPGLDRVFPFHFPQKSCALDFFVHLGNFVAEFRRTTRMRTGPSQS